MSEATWETMETLTGRPFRVRPLREDDTAHLVQIFENMGADSRYQRFGRPLPNPSPSYVWRQAETISQTAVQPHNFGLIAFADDDLPIASARYVALAEPYTAEFAISVRDDWQGIGVGRKLLHHLVQAAKTRGMHTMVASIQSDNEAMWAVARQLPQAARRRATDDIYNLYVDLTNL
ncbi:MAG: GNAT family N-acetyltransferase [Anaerolineales bacterium]|nr:GNAT family N-acetyltransferase [Anaerolineales bacterium]MCB8965522.1 GNAT family N-acetyltransferase [Ardenticatenaceae bacterium]